MKHVIRDYHEMSCLLIAVSRSLNQKPNGETGQAIKLCLSCQLEV